MSTRSNVPLFDDRYCHTCSSIGVKRRLSSFHCEHCRLPMCYACYQQHSAIVNVESSSLDKHSPRSTAALEKKQELLATFEEHCVRCVDSTFDEVSSDLQNLRKESIHYVRQQFRHAEIHLSSMKKNTPSSVTKSEQKLDFLTSPKMQLKMSTFPRHKLDLHCHLLINSTDGFSASYGGKVISTRCSSGQLTGVDNEKIDVETVVDELNRHTFTDKQTQTYDTAVSHTDGVPSSGENVEPSVSTRYVSQGVILTRYEVDRIASDGEHLLYFSHTSRALCYVTRILPTGKANDISITKEVTSRWPHGPILDLIYSPAASQFVCATKTGIYTCTIDSHSDDCTIDIQMQWSHVCSYARLSTDDTYLWIWTDTSQSSQLRVYSPRTFNCLRTFDLKQHPRFADNSTSFCIHKDLVATVFQYKQESKSRERRKYFRVNLSNSTDLRDLATISLGECDIDHEIRANDRGLFFLTTGQRTLWIVQSNGHREYVTLPYVGRALTVHRTDQILIANGTEKVQCVQLRRNDQGLLVNT